MVLLKLMVSLVVLGFAAADSTKHTSVIVRKYNEMGKTARKLQREVHLLKIKDIQQRNLTSLQIEKFKEVEKQRQLLVERERQLLQESELRMQIEIRKLEEQELELRKSIERKKNRAEGFKAIDHYRRRIKEIEDKLRNNEDAQSIDSLHVRIKDIENSKAMTTLEEKLIKQLLAKRRIDLVEKLLTEIEKKRRRVIEDSSRTAHETHVISEIERSINIADEKKTIKKSLSSSISHINQESDRKYGAEEKEVEQQEKHAFVKLSNVLQGGDQPVSDVAQQTGSSRPSILELLKKINTVKTDETDESPSEDLKKSLSDEEYEEKSVEDKAKLVDSLHELTLPYEAGPTNSLSLIYDEDSIEETTANPKAQPKTTATPMK